MLPPASSTKENVYDICNTCAENKFVLNSVIVFKRVDNGLNADLATSSTGVALGLNPQVHFIPSALANENSHFSKQPLPSDTHWSPIRRPSETMHPTSHLSWFE